MSNFDYHGDSSLERAAMNHYHRHVPRDEEESDPSQADIELETVRQYNAIPAADIVDILGDIEDTMAQVKHIGNAELMGRVVLKAMEVYATRHALAEFFGWGVVMPEMDKECAKLVAQWCLEQQKKPSNSLESVMGIGVADFPSLRGVKS